MGSLWCIFKSKKYACRVKSGNKYQVMKRGYIVTGTGYGGDSNDSVARRG